MTFNKYDIPFNRKSKDEKETNWKDVLLPYVSQTA
jgi:hypothetical protein